MSDVVPPSTGEPSFEEAPREVALVLDLDGFEGPIDVLLTLARLERVGMLILILVLFLLPFMAAELGYDFNPLAWLLGPPFTALFRFFLDLAGVLR